MGVTVVAGEEELGVQRRCPRCGDWWPLDATFWINVSAGRPGHAWPSTSSCGGREIERPCGLVSRPHCTVATIGAVGTQGLIRFAAWAARSMAGGPVPAPRPFLSPSGTCPPLGHHFTTEEAR